MRTRGVCGQDQGFLTPDEFAQQTFAGHAYVPASDVGRAHMLLILLLFLHDCPGLLRLGGGFFIIHIDTMVQVLEIRANGGGSAAKIRQTRARFMDLLHHLVTAKLIISYFRGDETGVDESKFVTIEMRPIIDGFGDHRIPFEEHVVSQDIQTKNFFMKGVSHEGLKKAEQRFKAAFEKAALKIWPVGANTGLEFPGNFDKVDSLARYFRRHGKVPTSGDELRISKRIERNLDRKRRKNRDYMRRRREREKRKAAKSRTPVEPQPRRFRIILPTNAGDESGSCGLFHGPEERSISEG